MNLTSAHLIKIAETLTKSTSIMSVHLCNNYELEDSNLKNEILTILGINVIKQQNYNQMKRERIIQAQRTFKEDKPNVNFDNIYKDLEPKEVSIVNNMVYQEEV